MPADRPVPFAVEMLPNGWQVGRFPALSALPGVAHMVTTLHGLDVHLVARDRERAGNLVADALDLDGMAVLEQVHRRRVVCADEPGLLGEGDGLVTLTPGLGVMAISADCPLILLADADGRAVGALHASWRGTVRQIALAGVAEMTERLDCDPARLVAAICPSAGPCCYEVGPE
ncbi:MAG: laccase domain-containing protein, partial [Planctomycetota bacterium]